MILLEIIRGREELRNANKSGRRSEEGFVCSTGAHTHRKLDSECELWNELQSCSRGATLAAAVDADQSTGISSGDRIRPRSSDPRRPKSDHVRVIQVASTESVPRISGHDRVI